MQSRPIVRCSRRARACSWRDADGAGFVDVQRQLLQVHGFVGEALVFLLGNLAAADAVALDAGGVGEEARGELFGAHFEREERDDAALVAAASSIVRRASR